jgi:hypothetical protein
MANAKINIDLKYNLDKSTYTQLINNLDSVIAKAQSIGSGTKENKLTKDLKAAGDAAKTLQGILNTS